MLTGSSSGVYAVSPVIAITILLARAQVNHDSGDGATPAPLGHRTIHIRPIFFNHRHTQISINSQTLAPNLPITATAKYYSPI
jgi:hypothetical protein